MERKKAHRAVWPQSPRGTPGENATVNLKGGSVNAQAEEAAEVEALCAEIERRFREEQFAEGSAGCDYPDGPLAASGCPW